MNRSSFQEASEESTLEVCGEEPALRRIVPGKQVGHCLYAAPGTKSAEILQVLADSRGSSSSFPREVISRSGGWTNGAEKKTAIVEVSIPQGIHPVTRTIEVVVSETKPNVRGVIEVVDAVWGVKGRACFRESCVRINKYTPIPENTMISLANQMIALYVVHGCGWRDRTGEEIELPQGPKATRTSKNRGRQYNKLARCRSADIH